MLYGPYEGRKPTRMVSCVLTGMAMLAVSVIVPASAADDKKLISEVTGVTFKPAQTPATPGSGTIESTGKVPTAGWSEGELRRTDEVTIPEALKDNLADYKHVAKAPAGVAAEVVSPAPVATAAIDERLRTTYEGVRVWSETNCVELRWRGEITTKVLTLAECKATQSGVEPK